MGEEDSALSIITVRNKGESDQTMFLNIDNRKMAIEAGNL